MAKINLNFIIPYVLFTFLFSVNPALAYNELLYKANNQTSLNLQYLDLNYREHNSRNQFLDGISGILPGLNLTVDKTIANFFLEGNFASYFKKNLSYTGEIIGFNELQSSAENSLYNASFKAGYILQSNTNTNFIPYVEYGYRHWNREIPPANFIFDISTNGYSEHYTNYFYNVGIKYQHAFTKPLVLSAFAAMGSTVNAHLRAHLPTSDVDINDKLGNSPITQAGVTADYLLQDNLHLLSGIHYAHFAYGKSNTSMGIYEPDSTTQTWAYTLGVALNF